MLICFSPQNIFGTYDKCKRLERLDGISLVIWRLSFKVIDCCGVLFDLGLLHDGPLFNVLHAT
jgi:hypothetical protein